MGDFKEWMNLQEKLALAGNYKGNLFQRLVAGMYMISPSMDSSAVPAFQDLEKKMGRQHEFLQSRFKFTNTHDDPYASMKDMTQQINRQKAAGVRHPEFKVLADAPGPEGSETQKGHPLYNNDTNVIQRGVHDAIAHYAGKHPFSARGEYGAYNRHLKTLCNIDQVGAGKCLAAKALFTEVVAQTSCFYVYGAFVEQKVVILNDFDHANVGLLAPSSRLNNYFVVQNKQMITRPDFDWQRFSSEFPKLAGELQRQEHLNQSKAPLQKIGA
jgi:hypothetical protein